MEEELRAEEAVQEACSQSWAPSPALRTQLRGGVWAVQLTCALSGASSLVALGQGRQAGFTLAHTLAWAALLPALRVVAVYRRLGEEAQRPCLGTSALCLFGAVVLLEMYELATLGIFAAWAQVLLWVVFALGLLALPFVPFASGKEEKHADRPAPAPEDATPPATGEAAAESAGVKAVETESTSARTRAGAGILGVLGLLAVGTFKAFGKVIGKLVLFKGLVNVFRLRLDWVTIAGGGALLLGSSFFVWFGIAKVRSRRPLGTVAALVGWAEIFGFALGLATGVGLVVRLAAAANQPGIGAAELAALERKFAHDVTLLGLALTVLWGSLTLWLFQALRRRRDPSEEADLAW